MRSPRSTRRESVLTLAVAEALERRVFLSTTFTVSNTSDSGAGSLRDAITRANSNPGADVIAFAIPGPGVHTISPATPLPAVTDSVTIDGYSQPGASANTRGSGDNAVLQVVLDGSNPAVMSMDGLHLSAANCTVRGIVFSNWSRNTVDPGSAALFIDTAGGDTVAGNFFGTDAAGETAATNFFAIIVNGSPNFRFGGTSPADRNLIAGTRGEGLLLTGASTGALIQGNYVGSDAAGTKKLGVDFGIILSGGASNATVGGTAAGAGNLVSGNNDVGIQITDAGTDNTLVEGNFIGTDLTGTKALGNGAGNGSGGIEVAGGASGAVIGGTTAAARNIISGNRSDGIIFVGGSPTVGGNCQVLGNYIGVDVTGAVKLGNGDDGITIGGGSGDVIGGTAPGSGNIISGSVLEGILVNGSATNISIQGNFIGTDVTGTVAIGNEDGVSVGNSGGGGSNVTIGGTTAAARNIISGNTRWGVDSPGAGAGVAIQGNYIGVDASGARALGNGVNGIRVGGVNTVVGGTAPGSGNVISGNADAGVMIIAASLVEGNFIGTDATGESAVPNHGGGIQADGSGGTTTITRNVVSGNDNGTSQGSFTGVGVRVDTSSSPVVIKSNLIGTDATGTRPLGNARSGVFLNQSSNVTIGGMSIGDGNVISNNGTLGTSGGAFADGITITGNGNFVEGNFIGTDGSGRASMGNAGAGVAFGVANNNLVGGACGQNVIAFNGMGGVTVGSNSTGDSVLGNSIFNNAGGGVLLQTSSGAPANNAQAAPALTAVFSAAGTTTIAGTLASAANANFRLQFFAVGAADPSGNGQGRIFLGTARVTTDGSGHATFNANVPTPIAPGKLITALATDAAGDTSAFAADVVATGAGAGVALVNGQLTVYGTAGDDTIHVSSAGATLTVVRDHRTRNFNAADVTSVLVMGGNGRNKLTVGRGVPPAMLVGGRCSDTLRGGAGANDTLKAGRGTDLLQARGGGNNQLIGGAGRDTLLAGNGNDTLTAGRGGNSLMGGSGFDSLVSGAGDDTLAAGGTRTAIHAGSGNDLLLAVNGFADTLFAGAGQDTVHVDAGGIDVLMGTFASTIVGN